MRDSAPISHEAGSASVTPRRSRSEGTVNVGGIFVDALAKRTVAALIVSL